MASGFVSIVKDCGLRIPMENGFLEKQCPYLWSDRMTKARNKKTESVRLSVQAVDFIRVMAEVNDISFSGMASRIVIEWAESKGMIKR